MTNRERSAEVVKQIVDIFGCPICQESMEVVAEKSIICSRNHTFDFARQGYINMLKRPSNQYYDKNLFESRRSIITESNLYASLHKIISEKITKYLDGHYKPAIILDAGSGEGSHLQRILDNYCNENIIGIGLDIAKEGIKMASRSYRNQIWLVGDLANIPLKDKSTHVILNILSPANYMEFKRILAPKGIIVKIVPQSNYFIELREAVFENNNKKDYSNDGTISLFKQNFQLVEEFRFNYFKKLRNNEIKELVQMSPLSWHVERERIDSFINRVFPGITIDLDILIGINKIDTYLESGE
ncbi:MAG TPA: methyltransferase domain-containing protein [Thermoanaerobacterales bacterium]|nr:methyltransferase domain-containing protein [Thermoanaerobacterales bacterium]